MPYNNKRKRGVLGGCYLITKNMCHIWLGAKTENGYAVRTVNGKWVRYHKYLYEQKYGPVSDGNVLDHKCRNRACINTDHLEPVPQKENVRRGLLPKIARDNFINNNPNKPKLFCKHGHLLSKDNVYYEHTRRRCKMCHKNRSKKYYYEKKRAA